MHRRLLRPAAIIATAVLLPGALAFRGDAGHRPATPGASGTSQPSHQSGAVATPFSPTGRYRNGALLPNGRLVRPAGRSMELGDFPVAIALSPSGGLAVVSNSGQGEGSNPDQGNESLQVVDVGTNRVVQTVADREKDQPTFYSSGLAFSPDGGHLYATGGGNDQVYDYEVRSGRLALAARWLSTRKHGPALPEAGDATGYSRGLAVTPDGATLVVTNEQGGSVAALATSDGSITWETQLPGQSEAGPYPGGVAIAPDGATAYVTAQGENAVFALDTATGAIPSATPVGDHPAAIALTHDGTTAFVANANDDSVSVLDLASAIPTVGPQISVHLFPGEANGSSPNAVAIDEARKMVYVANAGDDAVAVLGAVLGAGLDAAPKAWDPGAIRVLGFVPTGWYPTAVAVVPSDGSVLSVSAKGDGGVPVVLPTQYDGNDMLGLLTHAPAPTATSAAAGRKSGVSLLRFGARANRLRPTDSPIPDQAHAGDSPIKHVVLVVRENRTFDQVFGDLAALGRTDADVDPRYLEFGLADKHGKTVTPNAHALAAQFGLSDNFYSDGEASIQGHHWTTEGTSTDYSEKSWVHYYSSRNHPYDPTAPIVYPRCGAIFQQLAAHEISFRNFGELVGLATGQTPSSPAPGAACGTPGGAYDGVSAASHDLAYPDNLTLTSIKDTDRLSELERQYAPLVAADRVPSFSYVLMGNDHTDGTSPGKPTPQALVATNDLAVGGLVDYLSHTPQWPSTAVFIVEDDSQDGLDHRDGHRNILIVASPYVRRGAISHLHVSQASVLHAIELILGLPPLSTYTQNAPVPYDLFTSKPDLTPYTAVTPTYDMTATNPSGAEPGTAASVPVDLSQVDVAGPVLEAQLWEATRPGEPMPRQLLFELATRGGIRPAALRAWAHGGPCRCRPLQDGLTVAPGAGGDSDG